MQVKPGARARLPTASPSAGCGATAPFGPWPARVPYREQRIDERNSWPPPQLIGRSRANAGETMQIRISLRFTDEEIDAISAGDSRYRRARDIGSWVRQHVASALLALEDEAVRALESEGFWYPPSRRHVQVWLEPAEAEALCSESVESDVAIAARQKLCEAIRRLHEDSQGPGPRR